MADPDLSATEKSYISDCRLIAIENHTFYQRLYDGASPHFEKEIVGRVMAQKKDFIDATTLLLEAREDDGALPATPAETQNLVLTLPANEGCARSEEELIKIITGHEEKYDKALEICLDHVADEALGKVLAHHREAGQIALQAIFDVA